MNDFQSLVAELKAMAAREETRPPPQPAPRSPHDELAEQIVRESALLATEDKLRTLIDPSPQLLSAIDRARDRLHDEVIDLQRNQYMKTRRFADRIDQQNLENPGANYSYPAWVTGYLARFSHLAPKGQE